MACRASFLKLQWAALIRPYLSQSATARLVAAMIISCLDYCNSVFAGLPADQVARLQRIQNNAARFVWKKENEITLYLFSKNFTGYLWNSAASIRSRLWPIAISKGLYLRIFLHPSATMNHLDVSELQKLLKIPKRNLKSFGEHSFSFMAPSVWNSLPADLRNLLTLSQFKSNLKTFLFTQAFPQI